MKKNEARMSKKPRTNPNNYYLFFYLEQSIFWEQLIGYNTYKKSTGIVYFNLGKIIVETSKS